MVKSSTLWDNPASVIITLCALNFPSLTMRAAMPLVVCGCAQRLRCLGCMLLMDTSCVRGQTDRPGGAPALFGTGSLKHSLLAYPCSAINIFELTGGSAHRYKSAISDRCRQITTPDGLSNNRAEPASLSGQKTCGINCSRSSILGGVRHLWELCGLAHLCNLQILPALRAFNLGRPRNCQVRFRLKMKAFMRQEIKLVRPSPTSVCSEYGDCRSWSVAHCCMRLIDSRQDAGMDPGN